MFAVHALIAFLGNRYLLYGALVTIWLTAATMAIDLLLGTLLALARMSGRKMLSRSAGFYVRVFCGTPLLVQLVFIYTGLPQIGIKFGVVVSAFLALSLNEAAYLSGTVRAGSLGVPPGLTEAAKALDSPAKRCGALCSCHRRRG
jgi:polar amino acid transport system permease protein